MSPNGKRDGAREDGGNQGDGGKEEEIKVGGFSAAAQRMTRLLCSCFVSA